MGDKNGLNFIRESSFYVRRAPGLIFCFHSVSFSFHPNFVSLSNVLSFVGHLCVTMWHCCLVLSSEIWPPNELLHVHCSCSGWFELRNAINNFRHSLYVRTSNVSEQNECSEFGWDEIFMEFESIFVSNCDSKIVLLQIQPHPVLVTIGMKLKHVNYSLD